MKTTLLFRTRLLLSCMMLSVLSLSASVSHATVTSVLLSEDFTSVESSFPPANWSTDDNGNWHGSFNGDGGSNGSAMFDMYNACDYSMSDHLYSPQINASAYVVSGSSVTFGFDYWMEQNGYDFFNAPNHLVVYVNDGLGNQLQLDELWTNTDYTYDNSGDFSNTYYDPLTDATVWGHRTYQIPSSFLTSTMSISFLGEYVGTCQGGNFGVDNIVITGTMPQNISFAPANLTFGSTQKGFQSAPLCVTLTNSSAAAISLNSATIVGPQSAEYSVLGSLPESIPAFGSANVCIVFAPTATGNRTADLFISNGSDNTPIIDVPLSGIGVAPLIQIIPIGTVNTPTTMFKKTSTRLGGMLEQCLLVKNSGQGNLTVGGEGTYIGGDFPSEYSIERIPANSLVAGQSDTLCIIYHPTMEGGHSAKLFIASNADNGMQVVNLLGSGKIAKIVVAPALINFDSVGVGDQVCRTLTVTNPGSDTLIIKKNYLSSNDGDYLYLGLSTEKSIIPPGVTQNVSVCFTPLQKGLRQARLTFLTNIPKTFEAQPRDTGTVNIDISGTGVPYGKLSFTIAGSSVLDSALVGTQICHQATITNSGESDVKITSAQVSGSQAGDFSFSGITLPLVVRSQSSVTVTVCATPADRGVRQGTLVLNGVSNNRVSSVTIPLQVFGEAACASPNPLSLFENVKVIKNEMNTATIVVTNCGDIPATYSASVTGDGYSILSPVGGTIGPIAPNATATYQITFTPISIGVKSGTLLIRSSNVTDINIPLSGEGACATLASASQDVPATGVGASNTFDVTLTNSGNFDWTPGVGIMTPSDAYSVVSVTPATIPAGGTGVVKVKFSPKALGSATAELTFPNAGPCQESAVKVDFNGEGVVNSVKPTITLDGFSLAQNYPNPVNHSTTFSYTLPSDATIRITLSDMTGKIVRELTSGRVSGGVHTLTFDAANLASGTYVYTLECGAVRLSKDMVLSK